MPEKKLLVAEETSDLCSTDPEDMGKGKRNKKRKHNSSFSSLSEDDETVDFILPVPPSLNCSKIQMQEDAIIEKENRPVIEKINIRRQTAIQDTEEDSFTLSTINEKDYYNIRNSEPLNTSAGPSSPSLLTVNNAGGLHSSRTSAASNYMLLDTTSSPSTSSQKASENKMEGYLKAILRNQRVLNARQKIMEENLDTLTNIVNKMSSGTSSAGQEDLLRDIILLLPISSQRDMELLEQQLSDSEVSNQMICYLQRVGGGNAEQAMKLCLKKTICNNIAQNYSYLGQRGKLPFKNLILCKVIVDAVRKVTHASSNPLTDDLLDTIMSNWLCHA